MSTRERAVTALRAALAERSAELVDTSQGRRPEISILAGGSPLAKGYAPEESGRFWIFVDLIRPQPAFYIAPEWFVKRDIARTHAEYLARNGGERAITKDSTHHQISLPRIQQWRDRWDVVGL